MKKILLISLALAIGQYTSGQTTLTLYTSMDTPCLGDMVYLYSFPAAHWSGPDNFHGEGNVCIVTPKNMGVATYVATADTLTDSISVVVIDCSGSGIVEENDEISIYPNPTTDIINLPKGEWEIYNALGQQLLTGKDVHTSLAKFSAGIYYIRLTTSTGVSAEKVVKQ